MSKEISPLAPVFFVFSDGMDWARESLSDLCENIVFVENNDELSGEFDMYLMSLCHHFIIAGSGFSRFAALLSKRSRDKKVVFPRKRQSSSIEESTSGGLTNELGWRAISV
jgi:hypothetical protein